ncbi:MAG: hypothetical protein ABIG92_05115 [Candidatus Omnitrophota bacterium]
MTDKENKDEEIGRIKDVYKALENNTIESEKNIPRDNKGRFSEEEGKNAIDMAMLLSESKYVNIPFTVKEYHEIWKVKYPDKTISTSTIYNDLNKAIEKGLVVKSNKSSYYELTQRAKSLFSEGSDNKEERSQRNILYNVSEAKLYTKAEDGTLRKNKKFYLPGEDKIFLSLVNKPLNKKEDILDRQFAVTSLIDAGSEKIEELKDSSSSVYQWINTYKYLWEIDENERYGAFGSGKSAKRRIEQFIDEGIINKDTLSGDIKKAGKSAIKDEMSKKDEALLKIRTIDYYKEEAQELVDNIRKIAGQDGKVLNALADNLQRNIDKTNAPSLLGFIELVEKNKWDAISDLMHNLESLEYSVEEINAFLTFSALVINDEYAKVTYDDTKPASYKNGWLFIEKKKAEEHYWSDEEKEKDQVLNDSPEDIPVVVLTGSNMSGKSHYLKQNYFIQLLGQSFGYVPAKEANLRIYDHIAYLDRPSTDSYNDLSAFGKEIENWKPVIKDISSNSLVFVDEGYSTTSPEDQAKFSKATAEFIKDNNAHIMMASHNEEFINTLNGAEGTKFYHFEINVDGNTVDFTNRLRDGPGDSSALDVAKALGLPQSILDRSQNFLDGKIEPVEPNPNHLPKNITRYTEEEREGLKKETGNFLAFFPYENVLDIKPGYDGKNKLELKYKSPNKIDHYGYGFGSNDKLKEIYNFEPIFKLFSQDRDFSNFSPILSTDLGKIKNPNYITKIQSILKLGSSNDSKEILERQKMFSELISKPELRESMREDLLGIGNLMYSLVFARQYISFESFNLQFLESAIPDFRNRIVKDENKDVSMDLFLGILDMNLKLTGLAYEDIGVSEEIKKLQNLLSIESELAQLYEEDHRYWIENKDNMSSEGYKSQEKEFKNKVTALAKKFTEITGEKLVKEDKFYVTDIRESLKKICKDINEKAQEKIPPVSLFDENIWPILREETDRLYPFVDNELSRTVFSAPPHVIGFYYIKALLTDENLVEKLVGQLKSTDSVHLHQFANYFDKIFNVWFGEFKTGIDYLKHKNDLPGKIAEVEKNIKEEKAYQKSLIKGSEEITRILQDNPDFLQKRIDDCEAQIKNKEKDIVNYSEIVERNPGDGYWVNLLKESKDAKLNLEKELKDLPLVQKAVNGEISFGDNIDQDYLFKLVHDDFVGSKIRNLSSKLSMLKGELDSNPFERRSGFDEILNESFKMHVLLTMAYLMDYQGWKPVEFTNDLTIDMQDAWNLVKTKDEQVPLDFTMNDNEKVKIFSGSNMSGKTFAEKTLIWNALSGLTTGYAPNGGMKMPIFDHVVYIDRVTAQIDRKLSSFGHEIEYWKTFLNAIDDDDLALVIIDEMGSTTSPKYQSALSYAMSEEMLEKGHFLVVASHNHAYIDAFENTNDKYSNTYNLLTRIDEEGKAVFDYKLVPGHEPSNSIAVAKTMGFDKMVGYIEEDNKADELLIPILAEPYINHDKAVKDMVNPGNKDFVGLYGGAGADVSNVLYSTNATKVYFVDTRSVFLDKLKYYWQNTKLSQEEENLYKEYSKEKYFAGFGDVGKLIGDLELYLTGELKSIGVTSKDIIDINNDESGNLRIKFNWAYDKDSPKKEREIIFMQDDITKPSDKLIESINGKIDFYYQRAALDIPMKYNVFIKKIGDCMKPNGFMITDNNSPRGDFGFYYITPKLTDFKLLEDSKDMKTSAKEIENLRRGYMGPYGWAVSIMQKKAESLVSSEPTETSPGRGTGTNNPTQPTKNIPLDKKDIGAKLDGIKPKNISSINRDAKSAEVLKFLGDIDSAPSDKKAQLVVDYILNLSGMAFKTKSFPVSKERLDQIEDRQSKFLERYSKKHGLSPSLKKYINIQYRSLTKISEDKYATIASINRIDYFLVLSKDESGIEDFKLISMDSKDEIKKYQKIANNFVRKILPGDKNKKKREKVEDDISSFFNEIKRKANRDEEFDRFFKDTDHPDLPFSYALGSPALKVPELESAKEPIQLEAKTEERKYKTIAEITDEVLLKPIESLIKIDKDGNPRALTQDEILLEYKKGALEALRTKEGYEDESELKQWISLILKAIEYNDMEFNHIEKKEGWFLLDEISFPKLRESARKNILTAATIPRDGKTWVFIKENMNLYQAAYALTKLSGVEQKMTIVGLGEKCTETLRSSIRTVIQEAYKETKPIESSEIKDEEKNLDFHNRFLQKLHYSYKVDPEFRKAIDELREKVLSQIHPQESEAFRFITDNEITSFALEFAARIGETPLIADPYTSWGIIDNEKDEPHYFINYSELYAKHKKAIDKYTHYSHYEFIIDDGSWSGLKVKGGMNYLYNTLRNIFTYNEIVDFLKSETNKGLINPIVKPYETEQFFLPNIDFTRPSDEDAFDNMNIDQLFQAVENMPKEEWEKYKVNILNRYSYLARKGEIEPVFFMKHISALAKKDVDILRDKHASWASGHKYYFDRAEITRAIIETVLRSSKSSFLNDDFLLEYYSQADEVKDDGTFVYYETKDYKKTDEQISQVNAINRLANGYMGEGPISRYPLYALSMIMNISPERIGPKTMNLFVAMAEAGRDRYKLYIGDDRGWLEDSYGVTPVFDIPIRAFDYHPEYYSKLLVESKITPDILTFLIRPETAPGDNIGLFSSLREPGAEEREYKSFLSGEIIKGLVTGNSVEGNQLKLLKAIINDFSAVANNTILEHWRKFSKDDLNSLLGLKTKVDSSILEKMETIFSKEGLGNRVVALFLAMYPDFNIETAKDLDKLLKDDSVQTTFGILKAIKDKLWTIEEIRALYRANLWSFTSANVRHTNLKQVLNLSEEDKSKLFIVLSGKKLLPQNIFDIYPLNIPKDHALYDKYSHELKTYSMSYSSFTGAMEMVADSKELEESVKGRVTHRSRLLFNDLGAILKLPRKDLLRKVELLEKFETNKVELDNTAYRLLLVVPEEHFDELFGILEENFDSLKNLKQTKKEITAKFQDIVKLNPELKDLSQKTIVRWASEQMGITSRKRLTEPGAKDNIASAFRDKLKADDLGRKVNSGEASEEENKKYMNLIAVNKLLSAIVDNVKLYKSWLSEIPDAETDPSKMLPGKVLIEPNQTTETSPGPRSGLVENTIENSESEESKIQTQISEFLNITREINRSDSKQKVNYVFDKVGPNIDTILRGHLLDEGISAIRREITYDSKDLELFETSKYFLELLIENSTVFSSEDALAGRIQLLSKQYSMVERVVKECDDLLNNPALISEFADAVKGFKLDLEKQKNKMTNIIDYLKAKDFFEEGENPSEVLADIEIDHVVLDVMDGIGRPNSFVGILDALLIKGNIKSITVFSRSQDSLNIFIDRIGLEKFNELKEKGINFVVEKKLWEEGNNSEANLWAKVGNELFNIDRHMFGDKIGINRVTILNVKDKLSEGKMLIEHLNNM